MLEFMRVYYILSKVAWAKALENRSQVIIRMLSTVFPLLMMVVWLTVVNQVGPAANWQRSDFIAYYIGATLVYRFTFTFVVWEWDRDIRTGDLSFKLLKPIDPFHYFLSEQIGWKLFDPLLLVPVVALFVWMSPEVHYMIGLGKWIAFFISIIVGFALSMLMSCAFAMSAFWSTQSSSLYNLWYGVGQFLSGFIAPLPLFPENIRSIANLLPFRGLIGFPTEILIGKLSWPEIWLGFRVIGFWIIAFFIIYRLLWRYGLKKYEAVGS